MLRQMNPQDFTKKHPRSASMASKCISFPFFLCTVCIFISPSFSAAATTSAPNPKGLVFPVTKDLLTLQYTTQISQRTPLVPVKLALHLGGQTLWVDCENGFTSSSYRPAQCNSAECTIAKSENCYNCSSSSTPGGTPGCNQNACLNTPENPFIKTLYSGGEIAVDLITVQSINGGVVSVQDFIFTCVPTFLTEGLANGVKGTAGLGRSQIALPSQFAQSFGFARKFSMCLSSSNGVIFFGDVLPGSNGNGINISKSLTYTPLLTNPFGTGSIFYLKEPSSEYFIGVKSIKINGKTVPINKKLLKINRKGEGGTKISTGRPYTAMEPSIYKAVTEAFIRELANNNATIVAPVSPFSTCFSSKSIRTMAIPPIDLVLQSKNVYWRIFAANSMVQVNKDVMCLGFVDGGDRLTSSIIIGGHQIEDNFLLFDLSRSMLGFSSSLLYLQTKCSNFNFSLHV